MLTLGKKRIVVEYSRPSSRGRTIMGGLVPWNRIWRTGANRATHLYTQSDLRFGAVTVPAGTYTLYTVPNPEMWNLVINRETGQWGLVYHYDQDLARIPVKPETLVDPVDTLTIRLDPTAEGGVLSIAWERTRIALPFAVPK